MNASMFLRSASMQVAMLPLTSTTNTRSATPLVLARACGAGRVESGLGDALALGGALDGRLRQRFWHGTHRVNGSGCISSFGRLRETHD